MQITPEAHIPITSFPISELPLLERARLACNTIKAIFPDDTGEPTEEEKEIAQEAFAALTTAKTPMFAPAVAATYPNASMRHLENMLSEYEHELINSAVRIREFTKNKLLLEAENPDGRIRIRALELLGKMKDVGLFTDRIEITHKTKTDDELNAELNLKIERYMGTVEQEEPEDIEEVQESPEAPEPSKDAPNLSALIYSL